MTDPELETDDEIVVGFQKKRRKDERMSRKDVSVHRTLPMDDGSRMK